MDARVILALFAAALPIFAQEATITGVSVIKKPGAQSGVLQVAFTKGKPRKVVKNATAGFSIMENENILAIVPAPKPDANLGAYHLRYYEMSSGRSRLLGPVPFATAQFTGQKLADGEWLFNLVSGDSLVVADIHAIRSRLSNPSTIAAEELRAKDMLGLFSIGDTRRHVQFLLDGSVILLDRDGKAETGRWWTDGERMIAAFGTAAPVSWPKTSLVKAAGIPVGTQLVVRLLKPLSSRTAKEGDIVETVLISPAVVDEKILIPAGSEFNGTIRKVTSVGWGVARETASITLDFDSLTIPNRPKQAFPGRLIRVENSREKVDEKGTIRGLRSTGTLGYSAKGQIASVAAVDPIAFLFTSAAGTGVFGFTEPEILYPAGSELVVGITEPIVTAETFPRSKDTVSASASEREALRAFIEKLPFRTSTQGGNKPSDLTNLLFLGSPEALGRAFKAAGWHPASELTAGSTFQTLKSIAGDTGYSQAPMSMLLLDERPPIFTLSKTTNTFSSRHHLRVFDPVLKFDGTTALTSSSTQDIGIAFSRKKKTFIHVIDEYIDNERSKVVNDLGYTGCVDAVELIPRSWVPRDAYNSTGDKLRTDGAIAVLRLNDCANPKATSTEVPPAPNRFQRGVRNTVLTIKNDLFRSNLAYQGYSGFRKAQGFLSSGGELKEDAGAWRKSDALGDDYRGFGKRPNAPSARTDEDTGAQTLGGPGPDHRWDPPLVEIAVEGGFLRYPSNELEAVGVFIESTRPNLPSFALGLFDRVDNGWSAGVSVTLNSWRWVSSEFSYHYQRGKYRLESFIVDGIADDTDFTSNTVGLTTRQAEYSVLVHARPKESRWRPYIAAGPALQLISLASSPVTRPAGPFRLGLANIGLLKAAFDFGQTPPLDGGGIFQPALQFGGGIKFRVHPRLTMKADFRQTWSRDPDIIRDSYEDYQPFELEPSYDVRTIRVRSGSRFFQQRFTIGFAFTF